MIERAVASRPEPSGATTNRYGTRPVRPGLPGGLPTGAGLVSGSSSTVATWRPSGAISAITAVPPRGSASPTWRPLASSTYANVSRTTASRVPSLDADSQSTSRVSAFRPVPSGAARHTSGPQR